ncbi:MAG: hypothetical protein ACRCTP_17700 [Aeromonas popoffii]|uniref:hypothetical protein n=1 Tax=Aeromonas popoffii TaxID=70856 RepID=UPI003F310133
MKRDFRDSAPGDIVRHLELLLGPTTYTRGPHHRAVWGDLEVVWKNHTTRFTVITTPAIVMSNPELRGFLYANTSHGVVDGYQLTGGDIRQSFIIMPRYAEGFARVMAVCVLGELQGPDPRQCIDLTPDGFIEQLKVSQWKVTHGLDHPALVTPGPYTSYTHVTGHAEVIFTEGATYVGVWWPFEDSALVRMCKALKTWVCLVDRKAGVWERGHWGDYGADRGVMWTKWGISKATLVDLLNGLDRAKPKAKAKARGPKLPKPTHFNYTLH